MIHSQAETIERFEPTTDAEVLMHFEALERDVARENRSGVRDLVIFRLKNWKNEVRIGDPARLRTALEKISSLSANDYAFAKRAYLSAALLLHAALRLSA